MLTKLAHLTSELQIAIARDLTHLVESTPRLHTPWEEHSARTDGGRVADDDVEDAVGHARPPRELRQRQRRQRRRLRGLQHHLQAVSMTLDTRAQNLLCHTASKPTTLTLAFLADGLRAVR